MIAGLAAIFTVRRQALTKRLALALGRTQYRAVDPMQ